MPRHGEFLGLNQEPSNTQEAEQPNSTDQQSQSYAELGAARKARTMERINKSVDTIFASPDMVGDAAMKAHEKGGQLKDAVSEKVGGAIENAVLRVGEPVDKAVSAGKEKFENLKVRVNTSFEKNKTRMSQAKESMSNKWNAFLKEQKARRDAKEFLAARKKLDEAFVKYNKAAEKVGAKQYTKDENESPYPVAEVQGEQASA